MIKQTYKSKNRIKTTEKRASLSTQPETETLVETVLSASQVSLAAGASAPSCDSGPPPHQVIKLGIDVHLDRYMVVRQIDGGAVLPQPHQAMVPHTTALRGGRFASGSRRDELDAKNARLWDRADYSGGCAQPPAS